MLNVYTTMPEWDGTAPAEYRQHVIEQARWTEEAGCRGALIFSDNEQPARRANFPTGDVPRGGIRFKQMAAPQRDAAMNLLAVVFGPMGFEKVNEIREADK